MPSLPSDHCDKALQDASELGQFPQALMAVLNDNGLLDLALPASGFALGDLYAVLKEAGRFAVPLPLAELLLANRWLESSSMQVSIACGEGASGLGTEGIGAVDLVAPWGRQVDRVIELRGASAVIGTVAVLATDTNLAGEPRDRVRLEAERALTIPEDGFGLLALSRVVQMAGVMERVLEMTLQYALERKQFGRAIAKFQAVQHNLAVMATQVAAASRAADAVVDSIDSARFVLELAAAKARVGEAAGIVAESAHQVHGAMGYTHEHQLHHFTRRLWAWRDEYGTETHWLRLLGSHVAELGADSVWGFLATRG